MFLNKFDDILERQSLTFLFFTLSFSNLVCKWLTCISHNL